MINLNEKFITFEGPEGSGKTTQIKMLADYLESKGESVVVTKEPGGTKIGSKIRSILLDQENTDIDFDTELLLFTADRAQHLKEVIIPSLSQGKYVLCDRYIDSNVVYQHFGRGLEIQTILKYNRDFILPSKTLILMILPDEGLKRKTSQGEVTRFEKEDLAFQSRIYKGFGELSDFYKRYNYPCGDRLVTIEGLHSKEVVFEDIKKALNI